MLKNSFVDSTALSHAVDRVDQKLSGCRDERSLYGKVSERRVR